MSHTHYPLNIKHYTLNTTHYLKQRFIFVYRPMLGKVQVLHLMESLDKARRTACLRKRIVKALHQKLEV